MLKSTHLAFVGLAATFAALHLSVSSLAAIQPKAKRIEVAFVLDTTGSMSGLIEGAKQKIWSIANSIVDVNPDADIRMALIGYRDIGDDYVVKKYEMSDDIQGLYGNLIRFSADGGGDTPESVNEALDVVVNDIQWNSKDPETRRIVFLVGDAPPHMDYDEPDYKEIIADARQDGIIINTVQAGDDPETREYWEDMASLGKGSYFAIPQDGGQVQVYDSPWDDDILELQGRLDRTIVPYGSQQMQDEVKSKVETRSAAPASVRVDNSKYYSKRSEKELVTGGGDLLDDVRNNVRALDAIAAEELPEEYRALSKDELKKTVAERTQERERLEAEMAELVKKRDAHVAAEAAKEAVDAPVADSFDRKVTEALATQM